MPLPTLTLPATWVEKIQKVHGSPWHGQLEEAGTGSWIQSLLQTEAGASSTLDAAYTRYARSAQQAAYPNAPISRSVSAERVQYWATQRLKEDTTHTAHGFALSMSASLSTHNEAPGRDHHGWVALHTTDHRQWCIHFRLHRAPRITQQLACGLLGIEILYLLSQDKLHPDQLDRELQNQLEIDVWQNTPSTNTETLQTHLYLLQHGWSPLIYLHQGIAQRYVAPLRGKQILVAKGSFNPLTLAHSSLLDTATQAAQTNQDSKAQSKQPIQPVFELTLHNVDKGSIAAQSLHHRLCMLSTQNTPVVLSLTPTLLETKALFFHAQAHQVDFVCGIDLYERVLLPKYYTDTGGLEKALAELFDHHTQLWVADRPCETYPTLSENTISTSHAYLSQVHTLALDLPVSASAIRRAIAQNAPNWQVWVSPAVATYITSQGLFHA